MKIGNKYFKVNVASRVLTRKTAPPNGNHVFKANATIFELVQDIIEINFLTKVHEDRKINVSSRTNKRERPKNKMFLPTFMTSEHPDSHVFQQTRIIFIHIQNIIQTNILTKKNAPPPELIQDIETNLLTEFHDDRTINMASREKCHAPLGGHVLPPTGTIFELIQDIIEANLLTKFHEDWTINVASRVLTRKNAPPPGDHVFKATKTILELIQVIIRTNLLTKFHEDRKINVVSRVLTRKNAPPPGGQIFQPTGIILELVQGYFF
ncbi:hypothetical protein DPMN_137613 [Dreissena polymorpha]|uniref:Uncharacterized protein n=1 Tax=Dreissena polymorpha TaxID=45954 RepID=A0A9D4G870_DREPO|nr:hypothetical protein DPMN_137613 [Dreissena polymorpha]